MPVSARSLLLAGALVTLHAAVAPAQTDYRNLDDERPVRTEDAWPVERRALEWMAPFRYARHAGRGELEFTPELMWGAFANGMVGAKLPVVTTDRLGDGALAGPRLFGLVSLNAESRALPGFALRADAILPGGSAAGDGVLVTAKAIATRTWGRLRTHLNALVTLGDAADAPRADAPGRWSATVAADWSLVRQSTLVIAELATERPLVGDVQQWEVAVGLRRQLTPSLVLDAGMSRDVGGGAGPDFAFTLGLSRSFSLGTPKAQTQAQATAPRAGGGMQRRDETHYYPGAFNWQFLQRHNEAGRLFNAFDFGHAILYERLFTLPLPAAKTALDADYDFLVNDLLVAPPRYAIAEEAIEPSYAKLAWRAKQTFDWAHILHRQLYDAYADPRLTAAARDTLIERITDSYLANTRYALAAVPKGMELMDEQPFSKIFRDEVPRFNGLIWSYHWLQIGLYEAFLTDDDRANDSAAVNRVVGRWREMVASAPAGYPSVMPMAPAVAPRFSKAHPRAAAIFDNLHMLHDIISDILASPTIARDAKGAEISRQLDKMQDPTRDLMGWDHWWMMGDMMGGVGKMGGVAGK